MKQLLLIRHAKSSWDFIDTNDFDRPLNNRGLRDAPTMAKRLVEKKIAPDALISSPAKRAISTARIFADILNIKNSRLIEIPTLYEATVEIFYQQINQLSDDHNTILVFSHNTGITDFCNSLTTARVDNVPTCGIFAVKIAIQHWADFENTRKDFWFFDYPKIV